MYLTKYNNPLTQYNSFTYGDLFSDLFENFSHSINTKFYNVGETDKGYSLELELPGFKKEEISVEINKEILSITAKSKRKEINKSFSLWDGVDAENIEAVLEDGILKINLDKKEQPAPKKITLK